MTRDPVAMRIAQPLIDTFGVDPRLAAERLSDLYLMAAITVAVVNVATVTMIPMLIPETIHVVTAFGTRWICRQAAKQGPAYLAVQPFGMIHLVLRITMYHTLMISIMSAGIAIYLGIAGMVPISMFRWMLSGTEALMGLASLYAAICRRPPPRRTTRTRLAHG